MGKYGKRSASTRQEKKGPCTAALIFQNLPRESKDRLEQAMFHWARWHALEYPEEVLDMVGGIRLSGKVQCDPALFSGESQAWMDLPSQDAKPDLQAEFNVQYELASDVPRYDRQCNALDVQDSSTAKTNKQGHILVPESIARPPRASQRCFNCGSYGHGLKECWRQRDNEAIDQAKAGTGIKPAHSAAKRYFLSAPDASAASDAEFEGLQPGKLSTELREALGVGLLDPPPWIGRMRQLGYPPGYMRQQPAEQEAAEPPEEVHFLDNAHAQPINLQAIAGEQPASPAAADAPQDEVTLHLSSTALDYIPMAGDDQPDMDLGNGDDNDNDSVPPPPPPAELGVSQQGDSLLSHRADSTELPLEQIAFPGINAPPPEGADPAAWGVASTASTSQSCQPHKRAAPTWQASDPISIPAKRSRFSDPFPAPPHHPLGSGPISHQHSWQPPPMHATPPHAHAMPWSQQAHEQHAPRPPGPPRMPPFGPPPHMPGQQQPRHSWSAAEITAHADAQPPASPFTPQQWHSGPPPPHPVQDQHWAPQNSALSQQQQQQQQYPGWQPQQQQQFTQHLSAHGSYSFAQ